MAALRRAMTIDAAFFATADPETLLFTGAHSEDPLIAMAPMFLDNELSGHDVNTFPELVRAPGHVRSLDTATHSTWGESARYRDIMRPFGLGDELRAALVVGGHCWGYLCLHREDGALGFTAAEADLDPPPRPAHRGRPAPGRPAAPARPGRRAPPGRRGARPADGARGQHPRGRRPAPAHRARLHPAAAAGRRVLRRRRPRNGRPAAEPSGARGHRRLAQPSRLQRCPRPPRPASPWSSSPPSRSRRSAVLLAAYGLTTRELDIVRHVLRGDSTKTIANTLHISAHTRAGPPQSRCSTRWASAAVATSSDGCSSAVSPGMPAPSPNSSLTTSLNPSVTPRERGSGQVGRGA